MTSGSPPHMQTRLPDCGQDWPSADAAIDDAHTERRRLGADGGYTHGCDCADHDHGGADAGSQCAFGARQPGVDLLVVHHGHHDDIRTPACQVSR